MPNSGSPELAAERAALAGALFSPASIALVGASPDAAKLTSRPLRILRRHAYPGLIAPISLDHAAIDGLRTYPSLAEVPHGIEHALVMTSATGVLQAIEDCAAAGVKIATVLSSGFAELGRTGKRRQEMLTAAARRTGVRILGPNSLGVVDVHARMALSANAVFEQEELRPDGVSVISQSGSMLGAIVSRAQKRGIGFSRLVSVGNECDLGVGELTDLLVDDPGTRAILLFLEALRDAPRLAAAARRAFDAGKPVIAYKLGRSPASRELALTHTGATTSPDDVADAFFHDHGILRVGVFEALFEMPSLVLGHRPARSHRLATVTVSGGGAAMVLDGLRDAGVEAVAPPAELVAALAAKHVRIAASRAIDLPMGRADEGAYAAVLRALLESSHCDLVLAVQGSNATYMPQSVRERILAAEPGRKPLAVFLGPRAGEASRILQAHGVAAFRTPEACADALRAFAAWHAPVLPACSDADTRTGVSAAVAAAARPRPNELDAHRLLDALGIAVAPGQLVCSGADAVDLPFPVAAKIVSRDLPHKTDAGGVVLDIATQDALKHHIDALRSRISATHPQAAIDGVLVQTMQRGVGDVLIAYRHDAEIGPIVVLGMGGVYAELMPQRVVRCAPLGIDAAKEMIAALPPAALLQGYRGRPAGDVGALARAIHALSLLALAEHPRVLDAEINPLIVKTDGVVAVDALVRFDTSSPGGPQA